MTQCIETYEVAIEADDVIAVSDVTREAEAALPPHDDHEARVAVETLHRRLAEGAGRARHGGGVGLQAQTI